MAVYYIELKIFIKMVIIGSNAGGNKIMQVQIIILLVERRQIYPPQRHIFYITILLSTVYGAGRVNFRRIICICCDQCDKL